MCQRAADMLVLFDMEDGRYFELNDVGARVWELCDGTRNCSDLVAVIGQEYDAPREVIEADVTDLVQRMLERKLIVEALS
jgi:Coenzyme PQQ synthesis protein D (PqqD)